MARSYEIRLTAPGFDAPVQRVEELASAYDKLAAAEKRAMDAGGGGSSGGGSGGASRATRGAGSAEPKFLSGPNQRLLQIAEQRRTAERLDDGPQKDAVLKDLDILHFRADRSRILGERRLQQGGDARTAPGLLDLFQEMNGLMRSRDPFSAARHLSAGIDLIGAPGGLNIQQKLAGAAIGGAGDAGAAAGAAGGALEAEGALAALGPIALGVGAALAVGTLAVSVFAKTVAEGAAAAKEFARTRSMSGGSAGEVAGLTAAGIGSGEIAGLGNQLRQRLSSDPFAMMVGGAQLPAQFGSQDNAAILMQQIERLRAVREMQGAEEQLRQARILGLDSIIDQINVSKDVAAAERLDAKLRKEIFDDRTTQSARDLAAQSRRLGQEWSDLEAVIAKPFLRTMKDAAGGASDIERGAGKLLNSPAGQAAIAGGAAAFLIGLPGGIEILAILDALAAVGRGSKKGKADPVDANTEAINQLNATLIKFMTVGGGARARAAIPPAWRNEQNRQEVKDAARDLRGFRL